MVVVTYPFCYWSPYVGPREKRCFDYVPDKPEAWCDGCVAIVEVIDHKLKMAVLDAMLEESRHREPEPRPPPKKRRRR